MTNDDRYVLLAQRMESRALYHEDLAQRWRALKAFLVDGEGGIPPFTSQSKREESALQGED